MEYFTQEILTFDPYASKEIREAEDNKWIKAVHAYKTRVKSIENRLLKSVYKYYTTNTFHDCTLVSLQTDEQLKRTYPLILQIEIQKEDNSRIILTYSNVQKLQICYGSETLYRGFGSFVYDELLDRDEESLSHEIMLSTGSSIYIIFRNKGLKLTKKKSL